VKPKLTLMLCIDKFLAPSPTKMAGFERKDAAEKKTKQ
jgi:hypothetical protein